MASEFVGALPPAKVEEFFDSLVPSRADELLAAGRRALAAGGVRARAAPRGHRALRSPGRGSSAGPTTRRSKRSSRHEGDFAADGIAARIRLAKVGIASDAFDALDRGDREAALDGLLEAHRGRDGDTREDLRRCVIGILTELDPADPTAREYRRRLATALCERRHAPTSAREDLRRVVRSPRAVLGSAAAR